MADESDTNKTPESYSSNNSSDEEDLLPEPCTANDSLNNNLRNIINNVESLEGATCTVGQRVEEELTFITSFRVALTNIIGDENPLVNLLQPSADLRLPATFIKLHCVRQEIVHIRQQLQSYPETVERQPMSGAVMVDFSRHSNFSRNVDVHDNIEDAMADKSDPDMMAEEDMMPEPCTTNNSSNDNWRNIINNVETLEDAICMVGELAEFELSFSASFLAMVKDMIGEENPLVNLLQPSVDERIPSILFNLYVVHQWIVHIRQLLQSYPETVEHQPMPSTVSIDFSHCIDSPLNVGVHIDTKEGHGLDTANPGRPLD